MFWFIPLVCSSLILQTTFSEEDSKLLLVQALFRHGDRSPRHLYPKDPNKEDCWPEGLGKLTFLGKKQQYALGKFLRSRYQDFITTNPNEVLVNSSAAHRCLTSAEATMASFYAPEGRWKIYDDINWQPIAIHYLPPYQDKYLSFRGKCPRATAQMMKQLDSEEMQEIYKKNQVMFEEISNYVGMNISQGINALHLYDTLLIEKTYNLTIPEWAYLHWEDLRTTASTIFRSLFNSSLSLRLRAEPDITNNENEGDEDENDVSNEEDEDLSYESDED